MLKKSFDNVREKHPLVHNITNYVTVNDVANILLACGGSPIMADDSEEVEDITSICQGLNINIGTLNKNTIPSMFLAGKKANALGHVVLLDPVGAGASGLRTKTANELVRDIKFTVIRGNISEIRTLIEGTGNTKGVDADLADAVTEDNLDETIKKLKAFSKVTGSVIAVTGAIDLVADAEKCYVIRNGRPEMGAITGTGCQLSGMMTAFLCANIEQPLEAAAAAVCAMGIAVKLDLSILEKEKGIQHIVIELLMQSIIWMEIHWRREQSMSCVNREQLKKDLLLYAVTDRSWLGEETLYEQVEKALKGGATFVQLREKELDEEHFLEEAIALKELCHKYHVPFVINDNVKIAKKMDADGVHVGQSDMEADDVRKILGEDKILGVSAQTVEQAVLAEKMGADYLGVGAVFSTSTKKDASAISKERVKAICEAVHIPVIAIGGITADNILTLKGSGICGIAVVSAIFAAKDIEDATGVLLEKTTAMVNDKERH